MEAIVRSPYGGPWLAFREPVATVVAERPDEVTRALADVDRHIGTGLVAAGFATYEAAGAWGLPVSEQRSGLPVLAFGLFRPDGIESLAALPPAPAYRCSAWQAAIARDAHFERIAAIKRHIEAGDTYQINFTFRMDASMAGDPYGLFVDLVASQQGAWSAFVRTPTHAICSASPELLVRCEGGRLTCRPMKGTAPRGRSTAEDLAARDALLASEKNRAENVMMVDMARNDLGRLAAVGSVTVRSLFDAERYPAHWQLTSTIEAFTAERGLSPLFAHLFPPGSVTGAPKHRSMEIIRDLEDGPRGIYTGAVGFLGPDGRGHFNVAIRTALVDCATGRASFGVGSGIVWDSEAMEEFDECAVKAAVLAAPGRPFDLLETMKWEPSAGYFLRDFHLDRITASAGYFGHPCTRRELEARLDALAKTLTGATRVRLLLAPDGSVTLQAAAFVPRRQPLRLALASEPIDIRDVHLFHKTTRRDVHERARASRPGADAVVLWNEHGDATECHDSNLVAEIGGRRVTPPASAGLLEGTFRRHLLAHGEIEEASIPIAALRRATRLWAINSVQTWMEAQFEP